MATPQLPSKSHGSQMQWLSTSRANAPSMQGARPFERATTDVYDRIPCCGGFERENTHWRRVRRHSTGNTGVRLGRAIPNNPQRLFSVEDVVRESIRRQTL